MNNWKIDFQLVSAFPKRKKYLGICLLTPLDIHIKREFGHDVKISMPKAQWKKYTSRVNP